MLFVTANVFSAAEVAISAVNQSALVIKGNFFGTDKTQTFPLGSGTWAIESNGANSSIGGTAPADQNVFTNYQNPINAYNNSSADVIQNIFYCNSTVQLSDPTKGKNFIRITTLTNNSVGGDAPAGAIVQLYYTQTKCTTCNPNSCFATVTANGAGKWQYAGAITKNVLASSTLLNNTVGFQFDSLAQDEVTITNFDCHHGGSIVLKENRQSNFQFIWADGKGNTIGNAQNISNLQPGTYTLTMSENGTCPSVTGSFTVIDLTPKVFPQTVQLDCSHPTGSFTTYPSTGPGITVAKYYWEDAAGTLISSKQTINNLAAGNYYLYITDSNGCNSATVVCKVLPATATPVIDDSNAKVTDATCDQPNGSISGITLTNATGANYGWDRADGTIISSGQINLTNAPAGQYYFFVDYNFNCPPVKSKVFTVNSDNVITLSDAAVQITSSTCANSNGSITGITATGATVYQWFNSNNNVAGSSIDLVNVPTGNYYLVASNSTCSQQSKAYTIGNIPAFTAFPSTFVGTNATCNLANGSIAVTFSTDPDSSPKGYRWADANGATLISNAPLANVAAGAYQLYVTDSNGCESLYQTYTVSETPLIQIVPGSAQITNDQCGYSVGSIENISVTGGVPPYTYNWLNSANQSIGTSLNLTGLGQGVYTLQVKDATACGLATLDYTVTSETGFVAAPEADNVQVCAPGAALITVKAPQHGYSYRLYDSPDSPQPLADDSTGVFKVSVSAARSFYITQYSGNCESARVEVKIAIGLSGLTIPNTFTPNNDGINDFWVIEGIENYPNVLVQIFNRYGQRVFESRGYSQPFDGKTSGTALPVGVYYYIIKLDSNCSLLSGSLTLIR
jgi:gliding motility-associated-like protein